MRKINHFGIPTTTPQPGEVYVEGLKVWLTNFNESPNKIEYLRFEEGSWMPELIQKVAHIAYEVDDYPCGNCPRPKDGETTGIVNKPAIIDKGGSSK